MTSELGASSSGKVATSSGMELDSVRGLLVRNKRVVNFKIVHCRLFFSLFYFFFFLQTDDISPARNGIVIDVIYTFASI